MVPGEAAWIIPLNLLALMLETTNRMLKIAGLSVDFGTNFSSPLRWTLYENQVCCALSLEIICYWYFQFADFKIHLLCYISSSTGISNGKFTTCSWCLLGCSSHWYALGPLEASFLGHSTKWSVKSFPLCLLWVHSFNHALGGKKLSHAPPSISEHALISFYILQMGILHPEPWWHYFDVGLFPLCPLNSRDFGMRLLCS